MIQRRSFEMISDMNDFIRDKKLKRENIISVTEGLTLFYWID